VEQRLGVLERLLDVLSFQELSDLVARGLRQRQERLVRVLLRRAAPKLQNTQTRPALRAGKARARCRPTWAAVAQRGVSAQGLERTSHSRGRPVWRTSSGNSVAPAISGAPSKSFAIKLTNTLSSSSVNDFQFSRSGNDIFATTNPAGQALNEEIVAKFPSVFPHPKGSSFPALLVADGYAPLFHGAPWSNEEDLFIWKDDFAKVRGVHSLKVGGLFSHNIKNEFIPLGQGPYFLCGTNSRTGNAIADLLLKDLPLGCYFETDHQENVLGRWHDLEFYGNDMWKLGPGVTLTLGLRWSRYGQPYSANDRITNFIPRLYDGAGPASALIQAGTEGSIALWCSRTTKVSSRDWGLPGTSLVMARPRFGSAPDATWAGRLLLA